MANPFFLARSASDGGEQPKASRVSDQANALERNIARADARHAVEKNSTVRDRAGTPYDVVLENLSRTGFRIRSRYRLVPDDEIVVGLAGVGTREATVVWSKDQYAGCQFRHPISQEDVNGLLRAADVVVVGPFTRNLAVPPFSKRRRAAIITVAAIAAWLIFIATGYGTLALFRSLS